MSKPTLKLDRAYAPTVWVEFILEHAMGHTRGIAEQHLIGATLARRLKDVTVPNHAAFTGDSAGDIVMSKLAYHVTSTPSRNVLQKCWGNIKAGLQPVLLIPLEQENRARILAQDEGIDRDLMIIPIETFVAMNIIEIATEDSKDFFSILKEIVDIYNQRLSEVETDLSLRIEVR